MALVFGRCDVVLGMGLDNLEMRFLSPEDIEEVYPCFVEAFSNESRTIIINRQTFLQRLSRNGYQPGLSVGVWDGQRMIAFMLHCLTGQTAYNTGTGVLLDYRRKGLVSRMYDFSKPALRNAGAKHCLLEVLKTNQAALGAYARCGFVQNREFMLYALYSKNLRVSSPKIRFHIIEAEYADWQAYASLSSFEPSYQNTNDCILRDWADQRVIEAYHKAVLVGFCIFSPTSGRISQIAVGENFRRKGIGSALLAKVYYLSRVKEISILNVDSRAGEALEFFKRTGFVRPVIQVEMKHLLSE